MLLQELSEAFNSSVIIEVNGGTLLASGPELNSRETLDANGFSLVSSGVHLSDDEVLIVLEGFGKFIKDGSEFLAMAAPGSIELNKDVLSVIEDNGIEAFADEDDDIAFLSLGDFLGFEVSLEFTGFPVIEKVKDISFGDFGIHVKFLEVSSGVVDSDSGEVLAGDTDVLGESGLEAFSDVSDDNLDLALDLRGDGGENGVEFSSLLGVSVSVEEKSGGGLTEDELSALLVEFHEEGKGVLGDESLKSFLGNLGGVVSLVVEFLEEHNSSGFNSELGVGFLVGDVSEQGVVIASGDSLENFEIGGVVSEINDGNFGLSMECFDFSDGGQDLGGGAGLLFHPGNNLGLGSSTVVLGSDSVGEELEGRESFDAEFGGDGLVNGTVDLGQGDGRVSLLEDLSGSGVLGGQLLAVTAPGSVELDQDVLVVLDGGVEVVVSEDEDSFFFGEVDATCETNGDYQHDGK